MMDRAMTDKEYVAIRHARLDRDLAARWLRNRRGGYGMKFSIQEALRHARFDLDTDPNEEVANAAWRAVVEAGFPEEWRHEVYLQVVSTLESEGWELE